MTMIIIRHQNHYLRNYFVLAMGRVPQARLSAREILSFLGCLKFLKFLYLGIKVVDTITICIRSKA